MTAVVDVVRTSLAATVRAGTYAAVFLALSVSFALAGEGQPRRVVSINACTDQLLLALGDRAQIAGLSFNAADTTFSYYAERARGIALIRGSAEEVLKLKPDLVLGSSFTSRATRERLVAFNQRLELLPLAQTVDDVRALTLKVARLLGHPERGEAAVKRIDDQLKGAKRVANEISALNLQQRGYVSGGGTLLDDVLGRLNVSNAARDMAVSDIGRAHLEAIVKFQPDVLIVFGRARSARDQSNAVLFHPVLDRVFPAERRVVLASNLILCGGPQIADAIAQLAGVFAKVEPRVN